MELDRRGADAEIGERPVASWPRRDHRLIAVVRSEGRSYAIEDVCTHDGEALTGGPVEGGEIVCPRHGARFCLRTGEALTPPGV